MNPARVEGSFSRHHCSDKSHRCRSSGSVKPTLLFKGHSKMTGSKPPHSTFSSLLEGGGNEVDLGPVDRHWFEKARQHEISAEEVQDKAPQECRIPEAKPPSMQITETPTRHRRQQAVMPQLFSSPPTLFTPDDQRSFRQQRWKQCQEKQLRTNNSLHVFEGNTSLAMPNLIPITPHMPTKVSDAQTHPLGQLDTSLSPGRNHALDEPSPITPHIPTKVSDAQTHPLHELDTSPSPGRDHALDEPSPSAWFPPQVQTTPAFMKQLFKTPSTVSKLDDLSITTPSQFLSTPLRLSISLGVDLDNSNLSWTSSLATPQGTTNKKTTAALAFHTESHQESTVVAKALFTSMSETLDHQEGQRSHTDPDSHVNSLHLQSLHMSSAEEEEMLEATIESEAEDDIRKGKEGEDATDGTDEEKTAGKQADDEDPDDRRSGRNEAGFPRPHWDNSTHVSPSDEKILTRGGTKEKHRMMRGESCRTRINKDGIIEVRGGDAEMEAEGNDGDNCGSHHCSVLSVDAMCEANGASENEEVEDRAKEHNGVILTSSHISNEIADGTTKDLYPPLIPDMLGDDHLTSFTSVDAESASQAQRRDSPSIQPGSQISTENPMPGDASIPDKSNLSSFDQSRMEDTLAFFILTPPQTRSRLAKFKKQKLEKNQTLVPDASCLEKRAATSEVTSPDKCSTPGMAAEIADHLQESNEFRQTKTSISVIHVREEEGTLKESVENLSGIQQSQFSNNVLPPVDERCNIEPSDIQMKKHIHKLDKNLDDSKSDMQSLKDCSLEIPSQSANEPVSNKDDDFSSASVAQNHFSVTPITRTQAVLSTPTCNAGSPEIFSQISPNYEEALRHITDQVSESHHVECVRSPATRDGSCKVVPPQLQTPTVDPSCDGRMVSFQEVPVKTGLKDVNHNVSTVNSEVDIKQASHPEAETHDALNDSQGWNEQETPSQLFRMQPKAAATRKFFYPSSVADATKTKGPRAMQWMSEAVLVKTQEVNQEEQLVKEILPEPQPEKANGDETSNMEPPLPGASSIIHSSTPAPRNSAFVTFTNFIKSERTASVGNPARQTPLDYTNVHSLHKVMPSFVLHQPTTLKNTASANNASNSGTDLNQTTPLSRKTAVPRNNATYSGVRHWADASSYAKRLDMTTDKKQNGPKLNETIQRKPCHMLQLDPGKTLEGISENRSTSDIDVNRIRVSAVELGQDGASGECALTHHDANIPQGSRPRCKDEVQFNSDPVDSSNHCAAVKPNIAQQDVATPTRLSLRKSLEVCDGSVSGKEEQLVCEAQLDDIRKSREVCDGSVSGKEEQLVCEAQLDDIPASVGFSSASGKAIHISDSAMQKAKAAFEEEDGEQSAHSKNSSAILIKNKTCDKKSVFRDKGLNSIPNNVTFTAASGKAIQVSKSALQKAKLSFLEDDIHLRDNLPSLDPAAKIESILDASFPKAACFSSTRSETLQPSEMQGQHQGGHQEISGATGSSATLETSHTPDQVDGSTTHPLDMYKTQVSSDTSSAKELPNKLSQDQVPSLAGFASANGKPIAISKTAMQQAKKLFEEEVDEIPSTVRFATGAGRSIEISELALKKERVLLDESEDRECPAFGEIDSCFHNLQDEKEEQKNESDVSARLQPKFQPKSRNLPKGFRPFKAPSKVYPPAKSTHTSVKVPADPPAAPVRNSLQIRLGTSYNSMPNGTLSKGLKSIPEAGDLALSPDVPQVPVTESVEFEEYLSASQAQREIEAAEEMESAYAFMQAEDDGFSQFEEPVTNKSNPSDANMSTFASGIDGKAVTADKNIKRMIAGQLETTASEIVIKESISVQSVGHSNTSSQVSSQALDALDKAFLQSQSSAVEEMEIDESMPDALHQEADFNQPEKEQHFSVSAVSSEPGVLKTSQESPIPTGLFVGFQVAQNKSTTFNTEIIKSAGSTTEEAATQEEPCLGDPKQDFQKQDLPTFSGFQTAGGKQVTVSEEALKRARSLFSEGEMMQSGVQPLSPQGSHTTKVGSDSEGHRKGHANDLAGNRTEKDCNSFSVGFQTASGSKVTVSAESLARAHRFLTGDETDAESRRVDHGQPFSGFSTASGNKVSISKVALENAKKLLRESDEGEGMSYPECKRRRFDKVPNVAIPVGFQTAGGSSVSISQESLQAAKRVLDDTPRLSNTAVRATAGFQTAGGSSVSISQESLQAAKLVLDDTPRLSNTTPRATAGFQTAGGSSVSISQESLQAAKRVLDDTPRLSNTTPRATAGFQTAGGSSVSISQESLQAAKRVLDDMPRLSNATPRATSGFQTAGGSSVSISQESLQAAKRVLDDTPRLSNTASRATAGFQTAGGSSVSISQESLQAAQRVLDDTPRLSNAAPRATAGFQTAGGSSVSTSQESLQAAQRVLDDTPRLSNTTPRATAGFQTASGNRVMVSAESLATARRFLAADEADTKPKAADHGQAFPGFSTASGNQVPVSQAALAQARKLFEEPSCDDSSRMPITFDEDHRDPHKKLSDTAADVPIHRGFHTAAGSAVPISRSSLQKVQTLLRNDVPPSCDSGDSMSRRDLYQHGPIPVTSSTLTTSARTQTSASQPKMSPADSKLFTGDCSDAVVPEQAGKTKPYTPSYPNNCKTRTGAIKNRLEPQQQGRYQHRFAAPFTRQRSVASTISTSSFQPPYQTACHQTSQSGCDSGQLPHASQVVPQLIIPLLPPQEGAHLLEVDGGHTLHTHPNKRRLESGSSLHSSGPAPKRSKVQERVSGNFCRPKADNVLLSEIQAGGDLHGVWEQARRNQASRIQSKKTQVIKPQLGHLLGKRQVGTRVPLWELVNAQPPMQYSRLELLEEGVLPITLTVTSSSAEDFKFPLSDGADALETSEGELHEDGGRLVPDDLGLAGKQEFLSALLDMPGVDPKFVASEWVNNHYRWIVWKLASMEMAYPHQLAGRYLTPAQVLLQLKYRYDREIDHAHRPALKKILERDDVPSKRMVLCVAGIHHPETCVGVESNHEGTGGRDREKVPPSPLPTLELTDGWYAIKTVIDKPLAGLVNDGRIYVGQKLCIYGAELVGSQDACSPLEVPASLRLRISANATRRARYNARLGLQRFPQPFPLPLASLYPDGGTIGCVDVVVVRSYPMQFMEKQNGGGCVFRGRRAEEREVERSAQERQRRMEKLLSKLQDDYQAEESKKVSSNRRSSPPLRLSSQQVSALCTGQEVYEAITNAMDPGALQALLSERQILILNDYQRSLHERKQSDLEVQFRRAMEEAKQDCSIERNVTPLLRLRINDALSKPTTDLETYQLTVWRPTDEIIQLLTEGKRFKIFNVGTSSARFCMGSSRVQLSTTRATRYHAMPSPTPLPSGSAPYHPREVLSFPCTHTPGFQPAYGEVDAVGVVIMIQKADNSPGKSSSEMVYLSDAQRSVIAVKFWGGLQAQCLEVLVKPASCLALSSLQWRANSSASPIPCLHANDAASVTQSPKAPHLQLALKDLQVHIKDPKGFAQLMEQWTLDRIISSRSPAPRTPRQDNGPAVMSTTTPWSGCRVSGVSGRPGATPERRFSSDGRGASLTSSVTPRLIPDMNQLRPHAASTPIPTMASHAGPSIPGTGSLVVSPVSDQYVKRRLDANRRFDLLSRVPSPPPVSPFPIPLPGRMPRGFHLPSRRRSVPQPCSSYSPALSNTPVLKGCGIGVKRHSLLNRSQNGSPSDSGGFSKPEDVQNAAVNMPMKHNEALDVEELGQSPDAGRPRPDNFPDEDMTPSQQQVQEVLGMSYKSLGEIDWEWTQQIDVASPPGSATLTAQGSQHSLDFSYDTPSQSPPVKEEESSSALGSVNTKNLTVKDHKLEDAKPKEEVPLSPAFRESGLNDGNGEDTSKTKRKLSRRPSRIGRKLSRMSPGQSGCLDLSQRQVLKSGKEQCAANENGNHLKLEHQESDSDVKVCVNASGDKNLARNEHQSPAEELGARSFQTSSARSKDDLVVGHAVQVELPVRQQQVQQAVMGQRKRGKRSRADLSILEHSSLLGNESIPPTRRLTRSASRRSATGGIS